MGRERVEGGAVLRGREGTHPGDCGGFGTSYG